MSSAILKKTAKQGGFPGLEPRACSHKITRQAENGYCNRKLFNITAKSKK
jgi:hypothetical protein